jgi:polysaccharide biosynthesis transport protein
VGANGMRGSDATASAPSLWDRRAALVPVVRPLDLGWMLRALWRARWLILLCGLACLGVGLAYALSAPRLFTASTSILIGPRPVDVFAEAPLGATDQMELPFVDSQIEVLRSSRVLRRVVVAEKLADEPEFSENGDEAAAIRKLKSALDVRRIGLTYVVSISITTQNAGTSARIANAVANAFLQDNIDARSALALLAVNWLQSRVGTLRELAVSADARVQAYRVENNIVGTSKGLITDQKVSELATMVNEARSKLADGRAKASRIKLVLDRAGEASFEHAVLSDEPAGEIITNLRETYVANNLRIDELSKTYGPDHQTIVKLASENKSLEARMRQELKRVADSYAGDLEVAEARFATLQRNLDQAVNDANQSATAQVQLRDLEREAEAYRAVYQMSLSRLQEATQRETFPINEFRVIADAEPPAVKSWPLTAPIAGLSLAAGLALGALAGLAKAQWSVRIDKASDVEDSLGHPCLGVVPVSAASAKQPGPMNNPEAVAALRSARLAVQPQGAGGQGTLISVASTKRGEGRSAIAWALARGFAASARRTVLVDADFAKPGLSRLAGRDGEPGLFDILLGQTGIAEVVSIDEASRIHFLPAGQVRGGNNSSIVLEGHSADELFATLRRTFDVIVVDTGPIAESADALALAPHADSCLYVVRKSKVWSRQIKQALRGIEDIEGRIAGFVIACAEKPRQRWWHYA